MTRSRNTRCIVRSSGRGRYVISFLEATKTAAIASASSRRPGLSTGAILGREDHLGPQTALVAHRQLAPELVRHEGPNDRETRPAGRTAQPEPVVRDREHHVAVPLREPDADAVAAVLERVLEQLAEDERERRRAVAGERHLLELRVDVLAGADALHEHRAQPLDQLAELDVVVAPLRQHLVHGG